MKRRAVPLGAALHSICYKTIKSPALSSVDIVDSWDSASKLPEQPCIQKLCKYSFSCNTKKCLIRAMRDAC